jgi:hypothetical protein
LLLIVGRTISLILFTKFQNVIENSERWYDWTATLPKWLTEVTKLVKIVNARSHWQSSIGRGMTVRKERTGKFVLI